MLKPRDNFGPDAVALPRRNIFAPPSVNASSTASRTGGVFDVTSACRDDATVVDGAHAAAAVGVSASARLVPVVRVLAILLAAATVVLLLTSPGSREAPRVHPATWPSEASPTQTRGRHARREVTRKANARKSTSRRHRRPSRPRPRLGKRHRVTPAPLRPAAPRPTPVAPARRVAPNPRPASPLPARVPAGSPPEFL